MTFALDPVVTCEPDGATFRLAAPAIYAGQRDVWVIPGGFTTDFATIPAAVAWAIPKLGNYTGAAIVHDYFCEIGIRSGEISARDADAVFRRIMREQGVDAVTRWLVWTGVRWGAAVNPLRWPGWWRDLPAVLAISTLAAPVLLPGAVLAAAGRLVLRAASALSRLSSR